MKFLNLPTLPALAADPTGRSAGDVYYNTTTQRVRYYNGTIWRDLADRKQLLFQSPTAGFTWSNYHQSKLRIVGDTTATPVCGTFIATATSMLVTVSVEGINQGGGWAGFTLVTGRTAASASTPLFGPLTYPMSAAAGVTEFQSLPVGVFDIDDSAGRLLVAVPVTGLTLGVTYTWQLVTAVAASSYNNPLANNNNFGRMIVSPDNNYVALSLEGSNQVQIIRTGGRPGWSFGPNVISNPNEISQWYSTVNTAITVGTAPISLSFSPDNTKLAVANYTSGTVTFINVQTNAVIGTSALLHGAGTNTIGLAWLADSSAVLAYQSDGSLNLVTAVASPVITNVATGLAASTMDCLKRKDTNTTNNFWLVLNGAIIQGHITSGVWTQDSTFTPTGRTGGSSPTVDGSGNVYVPVTGGTYDKQVIEVTPGTTTVAANWTPHAGVAINMIATPADGLEIWCWMADGSVGAFQTSDGGLTQSWLTAATIQPLGTSPAITGVAESSDGYVYVSASSSAGNICLNWPGATTSFAPGLTAGQGVVVTAEAMV